MENENEEIILDGASSSFECSICGAIYKGNKNLRRHMRQKHPEDLRTEDNSDPKKIAHCLESNCGCAFRTRQELRNHLVKSHSFWKSRRSLRLSRSFFSGRIPLKTALTQVSSSQVVPGPTELEFSINISNVIDLESANKQRQVSFGLHTAFKFPYRFAHYIF